MAESPKLYQLRGEIVTVLVRPNQKRRTRPAPMFDLPRIGEYAPNNVLIRTADGDLTVRPFRGLRRTHA